MVKESSETFQIGPLNHVGVAVPDIEKAIAFYRDMLGATQISEPTVLAPQGVKYAFVDLPSGQVELIEPYGDTSPITKFLERNPKGGQHHICFEVDDIHVTKATMEARGMRVLSEPRIGAHGTLVVFLHPGDSGGVLIELMETHKDH